MTALAEVLALAARRPLRTSLTAFGVSWGLFMLVFMMGFGAGLEGVATTNFARRAANSVFIWGGRTSMPFQGARPGRRIGLRDGDVPDLATLKGVDAVAPRSQLGGWRSGNLVVSGNKSGAYNVMGDVPVMFDVSSVALTSGRLLNHLDVVEQRKVAVIGQQVAAELFTDRETIGAAVRIKGVYFTVVGVVRSTRADDRGDRDNSSIHVPLSTFQRAYNQGDRLGWIALKVAPGASSVDVEQDALALLRERNGVHPEDLTAFGSYNAQEEADVISNMFAGIRFFIWLVGAATLASGVVGVSNIMMVVVRERTAELGLRRAIGATRSSLVLMILLESTMVTVVAGMLGVTLGVAVVLGAAFVFGPNHEWVGTPEVDLAVVLWASVVLFIAGALSGVLPAVRAVRIQPVEALRTE